MSQSMVVRRPRGRRLRKSAPPPQQMQCIMRAVACPWPARRRARRAAGRPAAAAGCRRACASRGPRGTPRERRRRPVPQSRSGQGVYRLYGAPPCGAALRLAARPIEPSGAARRTRSTARRNDLREYLARRGLPTWGPAPSPPQPQYSTAWDRAQPPVVITTSSCKIQPKVVCYNRGTTVSCHFRDCYLGV